MSDRPKLIGMFEVSIPKIFRNVEPGVDEMISRIAVDEHGGLWGLVVRMVKIADQVRVDIPTRKVSSRLLRLSYVRFQKLVDVNFVSDNPVEFFEKETKDVT